MYKLPLISAVYGLVFDGLNLFTLLSRLSGVQQPLGDCITRPHEHVAEDIPSGAEP